MPALIDVVIVSYNSESHLRACVEPLADHPSLRVIVVDNASRDGSLASVADIPGVEAERLSTNRGFAHGCNAGSKSGEAPFVLFLNPDAVMEASSVLLLAQVLQHRPGVGAVGPKIVNHTGTIQFSQRRFPQIRSTYARALFLHRLFRNATWVDELVRDPNAYREPRSAEWLSGACLMLPRTVLDRLGGFDEQFFMYCEDIDLCRRVRELGLDIQFAPDAVALHDGGASAPRAELLPTLARSRLLYAAKHQGHLRHLERGGIALEAATHALISRRGRAARRGHAQALRLSLLGLTARRA